MPKGIGEMFEVNNQYQQSLLDLARGHDTPFNIDFYAYDARSSGEWNVVGSCASHSTFERVYKFFRDRHPQLLKSIEDIRPRQVARLVEARQIRAGTELQCKGAHDRNRVMALLKTSPPKSR
jgi:hypothetical protein